MRIIVGHVLSGPEFRIDSRPAAFGAQDGRIVIAAADAGETAPDLLALPALVNAHDHGYGIATLAVGAPDDALECWIPALANRPETDPQLEAQVAFGRMALAGIGTTVHCHNAFRRDRLGDESDAVSKAAAAVGIRVALSCPITDCNPLVYGDPAPLSDYGCPAEVLAAAAAPGIPGSEQIDNAVAAHRAHHSDLFNVQLGPIGPQWCREATLQRIAEVSADTGMRVHMHLLETERQRQWLDRQWPDGAVKRLDDFGLLSPRLTVAHGVWLRPQECELLAERGVTVAVNTSSNLRLRSGTAPVARFIEAGVNFGVGLDGAAFDDDQDMFREYRLLRRLQSGMSLADPMPPERILRAGLSDGFRAFDGSEDYGLLRSGGQADFAVLDLAAVLRDRLNEGTPLVELLLARARSSDVRHLIVDGCEIVRDGRLCRFDFAAAEAELIAQARARPSEASADLDATARRREAVRAYYDRQHHMK